MSSLERAKSGLLGQNVEDRDRLTILWKCDHPAYGALKPALVDRYESQVQRNCEVTDVLIVDIYTLSMAARWRRYFVVPRDSLEFTLAWEGDPSNPTYFLVDAKDDKRYEESALH